jgi:hypothetical protein
MGYDFHLAPEGPKLIEVNTNAGGAFLNALLAKAQRACCVEIEVATGKSKADDFELAVMRMFQHEWQLQHRAGMPQRIAIVDDRPEEQYLYPEFLLARRLIQKHGIEAVIADGRQLQYEHGQLLTPSTVLVTSDNAPQLWESRKTLFFKPARAREQSCLSRGQAHEGCVG